MTQLYYCFRVLSFSVLLLLILGLLSCRGEPYTTANSDGSGSYSTTNAPARECDRYQRLETNQHYGTYRDDNEPLKFDLYGPDGPCTDGTELLPLVILLHEGAFLNSYHRSNSVLTQGLAKDLARRGMITANIDYSSLGLDKSTLRRGADVINRTILEATQDTHAAIDYFRRNADHYGIDTDRIYLCGFSAGAILAMHTAFYTPGQGEYPPYDKLITTESELTRFAQTYDRVYDANIAGVIAINGGLPEMHMIDQDDQFDTKLVLIYGKDDRIVPCENGPLFEKYTDQDVELEMVDFTPDFVFDSNEDTWTYSMRWKLRIPQWMIQAARNLILPEYYGSVTLHDHCRETEGISVRKIELPEEDHSIMHDARGKINRRNYRRIVKEILRTVR